MDRPTQPEGAIKEDGDWRFTDGDPSPGGYLPTRISARIMNILIDELSNLVKESGQVLDGNDAKQIIKAIKEISKFRAYDAVVGDGPDQFETLTKAIENSSAGSRILITKDRHFDNTLTISKPDITISCLPGIRILGRGDGSIFKIDAPRVTFESVRVGFNQATDDNFAFELTDNAKHFLVTNSRVFGFPQKPFLKGSIPFVQSGLIIER